MSYAASRHLNLAAQGWVDNGAIDVFCSWTRSHLSPYLDLLPRSPMDQAVTIRKPRGHGCLGKSFTKSLHVSASDPWKHGAHLRQSLGEVHGKVCPKVWWLNSMSMTKSNMGCKWFYHFRSASKLTIEHWLNHLWLLQVTKNCACITADILWLTLGGSSLELDRHIMPAQTWDKKGSMELIPKPSIGGCIFRQHRCWGHHTSIVQYRNILCTINHKIIPSS